MLDSWSAIRVLVTLVESAQAYFGRIRSTSFFKREAAERESRISRFTISKRAQGRIETKSVQSVITSLAGWVAELEGFENISRIEAIRQISGRNGYIKSKETRYFISSLELNTATISKAFFNVLLYLPFFCEVPYYQSGRIFFVNFENLYVN